MTRAKYILDIAMTIAQGWEPSETVPKEEIREAEALLNSLGLAAGETSQREPFRNAPFFEARPDTRPLCPGGITAVLTMKAGV